MPGHSMCEPAPTRRQFVAGPISRAHRARSVAAISKALQHTTPRPLLLTQGYFHLLSSHLLPKLGNAGSAQQRGHGAHELQGAPCAACYTRMVARQREGAVGARAFACAGRHCKRLRLLAYIGPGSGTHRRWRGRQWRVTGGTWAGGTWSIT